MQERAITAAGLIAVVASAMFIGEKAILALISAIVALAAYEIYFTRKGKIAIVMVPIYMLLALAAVVLPISWSMAYLSIVLMVLFILALTFRWFSVTEVAYSFMMLALLVLTVFSIRNILAQGVLVLLYLMIATFLTDTFAFFGGKKFGKNKLAPRISPNKTVEGSISGYLAGALISFVFAYLFLLEQLGLPIIIAGSLFIPIISQLGDLSFSLIKRNYGIKDFGFIFPGHGGALDRIDSLIFAVLAFNIVLTLFL